MENGVIKFTAKGMQQLANDKQYELRTKEYQRIENEIIAAAKQGQYYIDTIIHYNETAEALQALGFKISIPSIEGINRAPNYYLISW